MGLYTTWQIINYPIYHSISYNCCLSNAYKLKLGYNVNIVLVEMKRVTGKEIAKHIIRPTKVIPASRVKATCDQLLSIINRLWKVLKRVKEREKRRERRLVGKRIILVLM